MTQLIYFVKMGLIERLLMFHVIVSLKLYLRLAGLSELLFFLGNTIG
jgi:hypothetical protein